MTTDSARDFVAFVRQLGAASGLLRFASIDSPTVRIVACDTEHTKVIEVDGKRYRAHVVHDDGVECLTWGARDEIKDGAK